MQTDNILFYDHPFNIIGFRKVRLGDILQRNPKKIAVNPDQQYMRPTVKLYGEGVVMRDQLPGKSIKSPDKFSVESGQLIISKIDVKSGAVGIVPADLHGAIVTWDFPHFNIDTRKVRPDFLLWALTRKGAGKYFKKISTGTGNRKRITLEKFLDTLIPLPSIRKQIAVMRSSVPPIK